MKFLEMFNPIEKGNYALTDEAIYNSISDKNDMIPIYGGNKTHIRSNRKVSASGVTKQGKPIKIFDGEGIIISLDGSAGCMTYKNNEKFALNHHAGFITKKNSDNKVRLEYFAIFYQNLLKSMSISDGSGTLSLKQLYGMEFDIPDYDTQCRILSRILPILDNVNKLSIIQNRYINLAAKQLSTTYNSYQVKNIPIDDVLDCMNGNTGLTKEFIYGTTQINTERYKILSGSTDDATNLGQVPLCRINNKEIKVFNNKEGLLVVRKGKAGVTRYLAPGRYTINDDAYILYEKEECPYYISLKWFMIQHRHNILAYASSSDNGTWNKTNFFNSFKIDIPSKEDQLRIIIEYERITDTIKQIEDIKNNLDNMLNKKVFLKND